MIAVLSFTAPTALFANDRVSRDSGRVVLSPEPPVLADRDDGRGPMLETGGVAAAGVIGPIRRDRADLLVLGDLVEQGREGRAVTLAAGGELDRPDVGCGYIHGQMNLAPLAPARRAMLAGVPFAIAKELDPGTVHQQVQWAICAAKGDLDGQRLLTTADRTVVRHGPVQPCEFQKRPHHAGSLAQRQFEQNLDGKAKLDRHVREHRRPAYPARGLSELLHLGGDQDQHRPTPLKRAVVHGPVRGTVAGRLWLAHASRLTHWIRRVNSQTMDFRNNAHPDCRAISVCGWCSLY